MLSPDDLESLITAKRREIESEKIVLGLSQPNNEKFRSKVNGVTIQVTSESSQKKSTERDGDTKEEDDMIPADLERYIRRYIGLPGMLKAGEYSPNNPLIRAERTSGDALLALGEYERRRNTLRKYQQQQYREYLDQQAKKKQEVKEQAEKERRELEQKEKEYEERQRQREQERLREKERATSPEKSRPSVSYLYNGASNSNTGKRDTGVQVGAISQPLSVAVQTDDSELFQISPSTSALTVAERELSPRTVADIENAHKGVQIDDRPIRKTNREKLVSDLRHTYMPSIFDADVIQNRNIQVEKEAAEKRQFYQQELRNQINEQQRIREERKNREKMLELAEMRRLEDQLRMLRLAQEKEVDKHHDITTQIKENASEFDMKRTSLQREIENEQQNVLRASVPSRTIIRNPTAKSEPKTHYFPKFYKTNIDKTHAKTNEPKDATFERIPHLGLPKKPFSSNISDNSIFSPNYDVDGYLRRNLNPKENYRLNTVGSESSGEDKRVVIEKALIHEPPTEKSIHERTKKYQPSFMKRDEIIPVLRHSPQPQGVSNKSDVSEKMRVVEDKWRVPAVQKNVLRSVQNESGDNISILTQLGSIRRQLQLEQLKLDNLMSGKDA